MKSISIITVNYNDKVGLEKTIKSVIYQKFRDFEFIIIDGNSFDGSKEVIENYKNELTLAISEPDKGIYNAMNKGIKLAKGKYLLFLNSGDTLSNEFVIEKINKELEPSFGIVYGDANYLENNALFTRTYPEKLSFQFFLSHNLSHQASFIRKDLFDSIFLYNEDYKIVSDWEFFIYSICKENTPYKHINLVVCNYDTTGLSSVIANHKAMHEERKETLQKYFPLFLDDYENIAALNNKRTKQYLYIKQKPVAYKILKAFMTIILLFMPKISKSNSL
jgi:glycosyltransferase involved in cell wall biosynthesis